MRLEFDKNKYVCCILYGCTSGACVEYTGAVPTQPVEYKDMDDWADRAQVQAYYLNAQGNLEYDAARAAALPNEDYVEPAPANFSSLEVAGEKFGWHPGDTLTIPGEYVLPAKVTGSRASIMTAIQLGMPIYANGFTVTGGIVFRSGTGYVNNMSYTDGITIGDGNYTFLFDIISAKAGWIQITCTGTTAFSNCTNNTPIVTGSASENLLVITFN